MSERDRDILFLLTEGLTGPEVAGRMGCSWAAVKRVSIRYGFNRTLRLIAQGRRQA